MPTNKSRTNRGETCLECGKHGQIKQRGLCASCYSRFRYQLTRKIPRQARGWYEDRLVELGKLAESHQGRHASEPSTFEELAKEARQQHGDRRRRCG